jgi:hypothetical protein
MKQLLSESLQVMRATHRDDQLAVMDYLFHNPHILSVDDTNQLFLCVYKVLAKTLSFNTTLGQLMIHQRPSSVGLLHFNGGTLHESSM